MLKVVKTVITQDEFIKEVEALFPGKFTEEGLRVLFDKLDDYGEGEYELSKIGDDFEEWTFERYQDYLIERFGKTSDKQKDWDLPTKESVERFLYEEIHEDDWSDSVVGFTDSTIMFTTYYTSKLAYELTKMYKRMKTVSIEEFCRKFYCTLEDNFEEAIKKYNNYYWGISKVIFRGRTDTEVTFEQYEFY
jgi:hypothetical protein